MAAHIGRIEEIYASFAAGLTHLRERQGDCGFSV